MIQLPTTPYVLLRDVVRPALEQLGVDKFGGPNAEVMLSTIAQQESGLKYRVQMGNGPARGLWQFEKGGGVAGVLRHPATAETMGRWCQLLNVAADAASVWNRLALDDVFAAGVARLLLYTDPSSLPRLDQTQTGWLLYNRVWRPGKPHPEKWAGYWAASVASLKL